MTRILCVDDDPGFLKTLVEEIETVGYEAITAVDGRDGLEKTLVHNPSLIISDIRMPEMDGYQFLTTLRLEYPEMAWTPFIFLSALSDRSDILRGKALGVDDYLTKPVDFEMLLATIGVRLDQIKRLADLHHKDMVELYNKIASATSRTRRDERETDKPGVMKVAIGD